MNPPTPEDVLRSVMRDALEERGHPWMVDLVVHRQALFGMLRSQRCERPCSAATYAADHPTTYHDHAAGSLHHDLTCVLGILLRAVGGPDETQRQVDAAHRDASNWISEIDRRSRKPFQDALAVLNTGGTLSLNGMPLGTVTELLSQRLAYIHQDPQLGSVLRGPAIDILRWVQFVEDQEGHSVSVYRIPAPLLDEMLETRWVVLSDDKQTLRSVPRNYEIGQR